MPYFVQIFLYKKKESITPQTMVASEGCAVVVCNERRGRRTTGTTLTLHGGNFQILGA